MNRWDKIDKDVVRALSMIMILDGRSKHWLGVYGQDLRFLITCAMIAASGRHINLPTITEFLKRYQGYSNPWRTGINRSIKRLVRSGYLKTGPKRKSRFERQNYLITAEGAKVLSELTGRINYHLSKYLKYWSTACYLISGTRHSPRYSTTLSRNSPNACKIDVRLPPFINNHAVFSNCIFQRTFICNSLIISVGDINFQRDFNQDLTGIHISSRIVTFIYHEPTEFSWRTLVSKNSIKGKTEGGAGPLVWHAWHVSGTI